MLARTASCRFTLGIAVAAFGLALGTAQAASRNIRPHAPDAVARLAAAGGQQTRVSLHPATGAVRFARFGASGLALDGATAREQGDRFWQQYGGAFGVIRPSAQLALVAERIDRLGATHLSYAQLHRGVPVFGAVVRLHFDRSGRLTAVNGTFVPEIRVSPVPLVDAAAAGEIALRTVGKQVSRPPGAEPLAVRASELMVFRAGLVKGVPGRNHLVWETEVGDGRTAREFVYVDAHRAVVVDQISGVHTDHTGDLYREAYTPDKLPEFLVWSEGDPYPTGDGDIDKVIDFTGDAYDVFSHVSGGEYLSYDGELGHMAATVIDPDDNPYGVGCPNAFAILDSTFFCPGVTPDDVVVHEWTHTYTNFTHGLIYQWQPGALNESYSDIFGEIGDEINGAGLPNDPRLPDKCSVHSLLAPDHTLRVTAPADIAGDYGAQKAGFGGDLPPDGLSAEFVLVDDGVVGDPDDPRATTSDGCELPFLNDVAGKVALIDRGFCEFGLKALNAEQSGAIAAVIINDLGDELLVMGGGVFGDQVTIPAVMIGLTDGTTIKSGLPGVEGSVLPDPFMLPPPDPDDLYSDESYRFLVGEASKAFGAAIRDMWNPTCHSNPGKVTDTQFYVCTISDAGGVHTNSGVPNHAFALLVDGGTYNGQTISALGWSQAAAIYWRAMSVYQVPASDFADHADAIEQSCQDLIGMPIYDIYTGTPAIDLISEADCEQIPKAAAAVELRTSPDEQCGFEPLLAKDPPPLCPVGEPIDLFFDDFETDPADRWAFSNEGPAPEYIPRDWEWDSTLPGDRAGAGMFALDSLALGNCADDNQSGAMYIDSGPIVVPEGVFKVGLQFQHYVATEPEWDGGNVKWTYNDSDWRTLTTTAPIVYNEYNVELDQIREFPPPPQNPLAGELAFSGTDEGQVVGSWGETQIVSNDDSVRPGDRLRFRFAFGVDGCNGNDGWYVDDVRVYTCVGGDWPQAETSKPAPAPPSNPGQPRTEVK